MKRSELRTTKHLVLNFHLKSFKLKQKYCALNVQRKRAINVDIEQVINSFRQ